MTLTFFSATVFVASLSSTAAIQDSDAKFFDLFRVVKIWLKRMALAVLGKMIYTFTNITS